MVFAEKGNASTWVRTPIQFEYRPDVLNTFVDENFKTLPQTPSVTDGNPYAKAALRFSRSPRPLLVSPHEKADLPRELLHYAPEIVYCGSLYPVID